MHILFLFFKVKKKGCILCRFGFVLWRKCASRYTNSPFIYSDIYSHTHAFCKHWLSTMSHTLSTTLRNSRSNHHPQGTYNPVKLLLPNESVEMRTQISMLLWEKGVWICHTIVYHLQGTFLRTVFQSPYVKEAKPHQKGLVNQDTSNLLLQKVQLTFIFAHCFQQFSEVKHPQD